MENEIQKPGPTIIGTFQKNDQGEIYWVDDPNGNWRMIKPDKKGIFTKHIESNDNIGYDKYGQPNQ